MLENIKEHFNNDITLYLNFQTSFIVNMLPDSKKKFNCFRIKCSILLDFQLQWKKTNKKTAFFFTHKNISNTIKFP